MAKRRLEFTEKKLKTTGYLKEYDQVFSEWQSENIIERVPDVELNIQSHYLPHRPVIKDTNSTTKIRPVFDASAKEKNQPSLNDCLEKGVNLIEQIPDLLLNFRKEKIGVTSDIKKAFLQISVHRNDRDFLRFLWKSEDGKEIVFRHRRVVFGVNSSPFLLGATINFHLNRLLTCKD
uniref:Reverse transcriptase domain-containing protein n=1 Tax=Photinus pyralis TaxID=7054 RepID=A0A1Y1MHI8_PHOPY